MKKSLRPLFMLLGAFVGGIVGHVACTWLAHQGYYALILPGGLVAIGAGIFRTHSLIVPPVCAAWAAFVSLLTEWHLFPFIADPSFSYFLAHIPSLRPMTLIIMAVGTLLAFFIPMQRRREKPAADESAR